MMIAFSKNKDVKVVGVELSPLFYMFSLINIALNRRKNVSLLYGNFFNIDLSQATVVYCFLIPKTLEKLKTKFLKELKPGTQVVSFAFPINWLKAHDVISGNAIPKVFFYKI